MRQRLQDVYNVVQEVNVLDSQDAANLALLARPELGVTFTKLHCWRLVQFEKCVFLDADTLVLQNCDELFEREELSAAPDVSWPDCFNSGVFVYRPSLETFGKITEFAVQHGSFDGGDQGLLNLYFDDWAQSDIKKHLPFIYNVAAFASYCYLPAFKQFRDKIKILHFAGKLKPWLIQFNSENRQALTPTEYAHAADLIQFWWNIFCDNVHQQLSDAMSAQGFSSECEAVMVRYAGLAGALSQLRLGEQRTPEQEAYEQLMRRQCWEAGQIDYAGRDSFDNIWKKITQTLESKPSPSPPKEEDKSAEKEQQNYVVENRNPPNNSPSPQIGAPVAVPQPEVDSETMAKAAAAVAAAAQAEKAESERLERINRMLQESAVMLEEQKVEERLPRPLLTVDTNNALLRRSRSPANRHNNAFSNNNNNNNNIYNNTNAQSLNAPRNLNRTPSPMQQQRQQLAIQKQLQQQQELQRQLEQEERQRRLIQQQKQQQEQAIQRQLQQQQQQQAIQKQLQQQQQAAQRQLQQIQQQQAKTVQRQPTTQQPKLTTPIQQQTLLQAQAQAQVPVQQQQTRTIVQEQPRKQLPQPPTTQQPQRPPRLHQHNHPQQQQQQAQAQTSQQSQAQSLAAKQAPTRSHRKNK
ncbi:glycogenin-2 isoform X2 [Ceratitis capitata]|uniref:glycogenin-2 isoform X2 n=1 Tax=Ceratitis capitata TaxID=7213 RepID=UPI0006189735|nr:glycogenin-2 isoform X2 [Ceratitis capitata]